LDLEDIVSDAVQEFTCNNTLDYVLNVSGEKIAVNADKQQMQTVITNVLQNCVESSDAVTVTIDILINKFEKASVISGQYIPEGSYGCVSIVDNGKGIIEEDLIKVFDPYYSTKQRGASKGMGLGLTVVYSTMRNHTGYVLVESKVGEGTQVRLLLPICKASMTTCAEHKGPDAEKRILLVEQDVQARQICKTILEFIGWEVLTEDEPDSILSMIRSSVTEDRQIDLMFIGELSGSTQPIDLLKAVQEVAPTINLIITGDSSIDKKLEKYRRYGVEHALTLPYTFEGIKKVIWDLNL
jgi:ActR/RegA family two-component response regulator